MLYSFLVSLSLFSAAFSVSRVTFSEISNFDSECLSDTAIDSISTLNPDSTNLWYCLYNDAIEAGRYIRNFYHSDGTRAKRDGRNTYSHSGTKSKKFVRSISVAAITDFSDEISLMWETDEGVLGASGSIYIDLEGAGAVDSEVESVVTRNSAPSSSSDYFASASDSYGDGDSLTVQSLSDTAYFCSRFVDVKQGQFFKIMVEGADSGVQRETDMNEVDGDYSGYNYWYAQSLSSFSSDGSLIVTGVLYDSSEKEIDSISITVTLVDESDGAVDSAVETVVARTSAPSDSSDYFASASDSYGDGDTLTVESLGDFAYFCARFSDVKQGQLIRIFVEGGSSGLDTVSDMKEVSGDFSGFSYWYGTTLNQYSNDATLVITAVLYDSSESEIDSQIITVTLVDASDNGESGNSASTSAPVASTADSVIARTSRPESFDDYRPTSSGAVNDGDELAVGSSITWFCAIYSKVEAGQSYDIRISAGDIEQSVNSDTFTSSTSGSAARAGGVTLGAFSDGDELEVTSYLFSQNGVLLDSKSITVTIAK